MVKNKGFTFIEAIIVVAIIGILASIAVPSYSKYLVKARRLDAKIGLRNAAQIMERCRTQSFTYVDCDDSAPTDSPDKYYTIGYGTPTASTFTLTATPTAGTSQANDAECATLILDQTGKTTVTPTTTDAADCW